MKGGIDVLIPKVFLSKELNNDELFGLVEDGLNMGKVKEVRKDLNNVEIISEWSRFELRLNDKELSIHQRWNKDKMAIIVVIVIASLIIWIPFLFLIYLIYKERQISKEILDKVGARINNT